MESLKRAEFLVDCREVCSFATPLSLMKILAVESSGHRGKKEIMDIQRIIKKTREIFHSNNLIYWLEIHN